MTRVKRGSYLLISQYYYAVCLQFYFLLCPFRFVMQTIESRHNIVVFCLAVFIRQFIISITRDSNNMRRVLQIHFFFFIKTINHILHSLIHCLLYTSDAADE